MSDSDSMAALIGQLEQARVDNGIVFGLSALVFYEYVITLQDEIEMAWKRRWNAATVLFMVNRYLMVVYNAVGNVSPTTSEVPVQILLDILTVLQFIVFAVFAALRIYAIWDRNIPLSLLVFALNLMPVIVNTYDFATDIILFFVDPLAGPQCFESSKLSHSLNFRLSLATRIALIVADMLVLFLTWKRTFGVKAKGVRLSVNTPFVTCIIRDGTIYFIALLIMNIAQIIMKEFPEFSSFPPTILFINSLTPVLISRFLINLRNVDRTVTSSGAGAHNHKYTVSAVSTMHFSDSGGSDDTRTRSRRIIGPLGEDLADGSWPGRTDEEEEESGSSTYRTEDGAEDKRYDVPLERGSHSDEKVTDAAEIQEVSRVEMTQV